MSLGMQRCWNNDSTCVGLTYVPGSKINERNMQKSFRGIIQVQKLNLCFVRLTVYKYNVKKTIDLTFSMISTRFTARHIFSVWYFHCQVTRSSDIFCATGTSSVLSIFCSHHQMVKSHLQENRNRHGQTNLHMKLVKSP